MLYLSGIYALNVENTLNTCGDWHTSALDWSNIKLEESTNSIFGSWGIEMNKSIPEHTELYNVADDLRAILDLMQHRNNLGYLKGFRDDFICTDEYNDIFFQKVILLRNLEHWADINELMQREFMFEWDNFLERSN